MEAAETKKPSFRRVRMTPEQRGEMLEKTRWSNDFLWQEIQVLANYMELMEVIRGATIFRQGDRKLFMCLILQGAVNVLKEDSAHRNRVLATVGPEKTLGEMALIDNQPRSASAVTAMDSVMFILTKDKFEEMGEEHPRVWGALLLKIGKLMSQRLRETSGELVDYLKPKR
jgi:CRP-like cAMP-binding protein